MFTFYLGGFIPSNFETESQIQHDKSAFSEYTLSRVT